MTRPGSHYWATRWSWISPRTGVSGATISFFNTGTQTTRTLTRASGSSASSCSSAEAPAGDSRFRVQWPFASDRPAVVRAYHGAGQSENRATEERR